MIAFLARSMNQNRRNVCFVIVECVVFVLEMNNMVTNPHAHNEFSSPTCATQLLLWTSPQPQILLIFLHTYTLASSPGSPVFQCMQKRREACSVSDVMCIGRRVLYITPNPCTCTFKNGCWFRWRF